MSPRLPGLKPAPAKGTGPGGRIEVSDLRDKLQEIRGEVDETAQASKSYAVAGAVAGVVVLVAVAFVLGRKRGRRKSTWVEIRRL